MASIRTLVARVVLTMRSRRFCMHCFSARIVLSLGVLWTSTSCDILKSARPSRQLGCGDLPERGQVEAVAREFRTEIEEIRGMDPELNRVAVFFDFDRCPGKGELVIEYGSTAQRTEIERRFLVRGRFHGVPVVLVNT